MNMEMGKDMVMVTVVIKKGTITEGDEVAVRFL